MKPKTRGPIMRVIHPGGGTAYALSYKTQKMAECVPLHSQALTKNGWETYHNLKIGDLILGYNQETDKCEWTALQAINRYDQALIQHWKNDMFEVHCTPEHKWAMEWESRGGKNPDSAEPTNYVRTDKVLWTIEEAKDRARIIQAAPGPESSGWYPERHELLSRQRTVQNVLQMTSGQRLAFIHGMMEGEGCWTGAGGTLQFSQALGPVLDAFQLACFLEGIATSPKVREDNRKESYKTTCKATLLKSHKRMVNSMRLLDEYEDSVWCPTTALGTWVMKQGQVVTITGNSLQGGEKPQIILCGHYHKFDWNYHREIHNVMVGCLEDQTLFMRKNNIPAHLGYCIVEMKIHPSGTLESVKVQWTPWYDRGFYARWTKKQDID